jgi:aspartate kinase
MVAPSPAAAPPAPPDRDTAGRVVVQKFGGTSVGDLERIRKVAARVQRTVLAGHKVALTVSAMGRSTDQLVATAREVTPRPERRELDMLMATGEQVSIALVAMALQHAGVRPRSFTGARRASAPTASTAARGSSRSTRARCSARSPTSTWRWSPASRA